MPDGNWSISIVQLPILPGIAYHDIIVMWDGNGNKVGEIDGGPEDPNQPGQLASISPSTIGTFLSGDTPLITEYNTNSRNIYYNSSLGTGTTILSGSQAAVQQAFNAGTEAAATIDTLGLNYSLLTTNSNSVAATVYAAITGQQLPSNSQLYAYGPGSGNVLLSEDQLNGIEYDLPPIGTQLQNYEQQETLPDGNIQTSYYNGSTLVSQTVQQPDGTIISETSYNPDGTTSTLTVVLRIRAASCSDRQDFAMVSPDGSHDAYLNERYCAYGPFGGTYYILSMRSTTAADSEIEFFSTERAIPPGLLWVGARRVVVAINDVAWIGLSLHNVDGIEVDYRLAENLSDENIAEREREWEKQSLAEIHRHPLSADQLEIELARFEQVKAVEQESLRNFKAWARANIPNAFSQEQVSK